MIRRCKTNFPGNKNFDDTYQLNFHIFLWNLILKVLFFIQQSISKILQLNFVLVIIQMDMFFLQDICIHSNSSIENSFDSIELECKEIFLYSSLSRHLIFNFRYASQLAISLYQAKSRVFVKKYLAFESQSLFKKKFLNKFKISIPFTAATARLRLVYQFFLKFLPGASF